MIARIIDLSIKHRAMVLLLVAGLSGAAGIFAQQIHLDALPDLSDTQVIIYSEYAGQSPTVVEDQVTYPLSASMLAVPRAKTVRAYSFFGFSLVYILFEDGTDLDWARSRVSEAMSVLTNSLPQGVTPQLGPDATGVGWVYQYVLLEYGPFARALRAALDADQNGEVSLAEARSQAPASPAKLRALFERSKNIDPDEGVTFSLEDFDDDHSGALNAAELRVAANFQGVDLAQLRDLQDWFLRYELSAVPGVAEVASIGGFVKQYQVELDPERLRAHQLSLKRIKRAIARSNSDVGGRTIEMAETEFMVRGLGALRSIDDLRTIPLGVSDSHVPVLLGDVANIHLGPSARRGLVDWNGQGDTAAGIIVMRASANALEVIRAVKARLKVLGPSLGRGIRVQTAYDRSSLILRAVDTLSRKLREELIVVALVCFAFLMHLRSALVALITLPIALSFALAAMRLLGINANIMSLGGIAIAVGVMVDASIVMVENAHKHRARAPDMPPALAIKAAAIEVGPALFYALLIVTVSFLPVFGLQSQEGRLFSPLAFTKTFAMAASSLLAITLIPALMVYLIRGKISEERANPLSRLSFALYSPALQAALQRPRTTLLLSLALLLATAYPLSKLGREFMPPLDEGDILYMPTTLPGISITKAKQLLQQTDRLIGQFPEVKRVFGKIGRANTATDPAPLSMLETTIMLQEDRARWRTKKVSRWYSGRAPETLKPLLRWIWPEQVPMNKRDLIAQLNERLALPGLTNAWTMPIKARVDMLATGLKTPVGIRISGPDLSVLAELGPQLEPILKRVPGTLSVFSERALGGRFIDIQVDRAEAARYGLTTADVLEVVQTAIGGAQVTVAQKGPQRIPVTLRYARALRSDPEALGQILVSSPTGHHVPLGQLARISLSDGPAVIKSENGRRCMWVYIELDDTDLGTYVERAQAAVQQQLKLPAGVSIHWAGQYTSMLRAKARLKLLIPLTLLIVLVILYLHFRSIKECMLVMMTVPFSMIGGIWLMYLLDFELSIAVAVGFIALAGLATETGVVMLVYLKSARERFSSEGLLTDRAALRLAVIEGSVERLRPKLMTVATTLLGLMPVMFGTGTGSEVMKRIAAPMVGGLITSTAMTLIVLPVVFAMVSRPDISPAK